jgi:XTP/dITP diphosphohydrolase
MLTSSSSNRIVIATRNQGKAFEIGAILRDLRLQLLSLDDFEVNEAEETEDSFVGNAISKARYYANATNEYVLADDSGLEVAALGGEPGVLSARYAGPEASDHDRRVKLLRELALSRSPDRSARFVCAVAIVKPNQELLSVTESFCDGSICESPRGDSGFGYDPIFVPEGYDQTFAELPEEVKNQISHRGKALLAMRDLLLTRMGLLDRVELDS